MLSVSTRRLAISPYALFLMRGALSAPHMKGLGRKARAAQASLDYTRLKASERAALEKAAKSHPSFARKPQGKTASKLSDYQQFVRKRMATCRGSPRTRMQKVAKLWRCRPV